MKKISISKVEETRTPRRAKRVGDFVAPAAGSVQSVEGLEKMLREWENRNARCRIRMKDVMHEKGRSYDLKLVTKICRNYNIPGIWYKMDGVRLWYPLPSEVRSCCQSISLPNIKFPYTLIDHCRTLKHCAMLHGIDPKVARSKTVRTWWKLRKGQKK